MQKDSELDILGFVALGGLLRRFMKLGAFWVQILSGSGCLGVVVPRD